MGAVNSIGDGDEHVVPAMIAGLVSADEQQRHATWIKSVEHTQRTPAVLDPELAHMPVARSDYAGTVWKW